MKGKLLSITFMIVTLVVLSACNLQISAAGPPDAPETEAAGGPETEAPGELETVDLSGLDVGTTMRWHDNSLLVYVPEGEFVMGANETDNPVRTVFLDDYWAYKTKVTNDMYRLCVAAGVCTPPADEIPFPEYLNPNIKDHPVVGVTWEQADTYCTWMHARLPKEAEWEKIARGPLGNPYPWGQAAPSCDLLNFADCDLGGTNNVTDYADGLSYYTAADMAGNAYEWVADWYLADYFSQAPEENPAGPETGTVRSVRGSGFKTGTDFIPSALRGYLDPETYREDLGFRCVISADAIAGFAPFCQLAGHVPGLDWGIPEPPPGGPGAVEPPPLGDPCVPDPISFRATQYCADSSRNEGGATLTFTGEMVMSGGDCDAGGSPVGCVGGEGESFEVRICSSCVPLDLLRPEIEPTCSDGYVLADGWCIFEGFPPVPRGDCPPGSFLDPETGLCQFPLPLPDSDLCPEGYSYFEERSCCVALFADPIPDMPGIPEHWYPGCPIGSTYDPATGACVPPEGESWGRVEECESFPVTLGYCPDSGDDDPGGCVDPPGCLPPPNCGAPPQYNNPCCCP